MHYPKLPSFFPSQPNRNHQPLLIPFLPPFTQLKCLPTELNFNINISTSTVNIFFISVEIKNQSVKMPGASNNKDGASQYGLTPREVDLVIKAMITMVENNVKVR